VGIAIHLERHRHGGARPAVRVCHCPSPARRRVLALAPQPSLRPIARHAE
jgi:hypothetical protein